jgi:GAF domain-containing protein
MTFVLPAAAPAPADANPDVSKLLAGEELALRLIQAGAPPKEIFETLVRTLEATFDHGVVGSLMVLDPTGKHLCHGAAPSLPDIYNRVVDGIPIGGYGTCCAAAFRNEIVVTTDIEHDAGWAKLKEYPLAIRLRAAWSHPIRGTAGQVLGTLGTYFHECRAPTDGERAVVAMLARTAALAIEQSVVAESVA